MRRSTINEFDKLGDKLSTQVSMMKYRLMNLCIKSEPVALLPIQVFIEGEAQYLEKCATIGKSDEYHFEILPKYEEDMKSIMQAVMRAHPEFKQSIQTIQVESSDANGESKNKDVHYLQLTMPEVNDDRYDVLNEAVKLVYNECKAQMDAINATAKPKFAELAQFEDDDDKELLKKGLEKQKAEWDEKCEGLYNNKLKEIEDAHNKWLAEQANSTQVRQERDNAQNDKAAHSMRMNPNEGN